MGSAYKVEVMPMRILIADNWPNVQNALRALLDQQPGWEVVGEVADAGELLARVEEACPDAVLLGWELPGLQGTDRLSALRMACPETLLVVLSAQPGARQAALAGGADAFASKVGPPEQLLSAIVGRRRTGGGAGFPLDEGWSGQHQEAGQPPCLDVPVEGEVGCRRIADMPTDRRSIMAEAEAKKGKSLRYIAVIAMAAVLLACIAAGLTVSLVLVDQIPFYHIFPR